MYNSRLVVLHCVYMDRSDYHHSLKQAKKRKKPEKTIYILKINMHHQRQTEKNSNWKNLERKDKGWRDLEMYR